MSNTDIRLSQNTTDADEVPLSWRDQLLDTLESSSRLIALLAAWVATCGSLFMSEVLGWQPCLLCWYQRILMYPLAIVLAVGIFRRDRDVQWYVLPLSTLGICVSLYHYLLIKTTWLPEPACSVSVPCNIDYLNWLGFINIPFLALTAFIIITLMMFAWMWSRRPEESAADEESPTWFEGDRIAAILTIALVIVAFGLGATFV